DVSERLKTEQALRRCEDQLRRWERMESAGRVAAGMAHDFNHLLTAVLSNIAVVLANMPNDDRNRGFLATAERAALEAAEIVRRLLTSTLRNKRRMAPVSLNTLVAEIADFLSGVMDPCIGLQLRPANGLWSVRGDRAQLKEAILNLCLNARDAMPGRGTLLVETENVVHEKGGGNAPTWSRRQDFVCLRVSDTGGGIPADVQARMYEPFFTTKGSRGTGIGLALVAAIVASHGGWIDCHSEVGQGTLFDVYLPRSIAAPRGQSQLDRGDAADSERRQLAPA